MAPFPSKLVTAYPPWCEDVGSQNPEPTPQPFALTLPHVIRRNTDLYKAIGEMDDLTDKALKERLIPLCRELQEYQEQDQEQIHGLSKAIVAKYGECSIRVMRRTWDLYLALTTTPEIPGDDPGIFDQTEWLSSIRRVFADDFQVISKFQEEGLQSTYVTDVLVQEQSDRIKRAEKEREIFQAMHNELTQEDLEDMPAYKSTALGEAPLSALRRCIYTAQVFHQALRDRGEEVLENDEEEIKWLYQAKQLWHIAGRAAMSWAPRRHGEIQGILTVYCQDLITRRRREGYERDAGLRAQLEAILGDTRHGNAYLVTDESNSDENEDENAEDKGKENAD
ncbi:hypothetical protein NW754_009163 [Fusarium falciforme]|uniref:Uncharacterized protein n=1 Tax=Fusarium falciforme TaxID=195108 RepID=A0A9W8RCR2_9HYPO|nr:hypothetical protein NW754_009163 [Fusarium falciforme]KAJ4191586.1 hypothetical protein NW755_004770 [Fusarium falciforme]KAJ4206673.1 hypothetical protein NW767_002959 [Fusarium falciforme]